MDSSSAMQQKRNVRKEVWDRMEELDVLVNHKPTYVRVPGFQGSEECASKLMEMEVIKQAKCIYSDIDLPLLSSVKELIKLGKMVLVQDMKSSRGFLSTPGNIDRITGKERSFSRIMRVIHQDSSVIAYNKVPHIDVLLLSSVVASKSGRRMGSDTLYSRQLYPLLATLGVVDDTTQIITLVHDLQVADFTDDPAMTLQVPANFIITPTQTYSTADQPDRPQRVHELDWAAFPEGVVKRARWLQKFRDGDMSGFTDEGPGEGESEVKQEGTGSGEGVRESKRTRSRTRPSRRYRETYSSRKSRKSLDSVASQDPEAAPSQQAGNPETGLKSEEGDKGGRSGKSRRVSRGDGKRPRRSRNDSKRKRNPENRSSSEAAESAENDEEVKTTEGRESRRRSRSDRRKLPCIYIGGFLRNLRFSEVKNMVWDCKVDPDQIVRIAYTSYAFLYFKSEEEMKTAMVALEELRKSDENIRVEVSNSTRKRSKSGPRVGEDKAEVAAGDTNESQTAATDPAAVKVKVEEKQDGDQLQEPPTQQQQLQVQEQQQPQEVAAQ